MNIQDALTGVKMIAFDTAPVIYYVENRATYADKMDEVIQHIDLNNIQVICASLALTETLTKPIKHGDTNVAHAYRQFFKTPPIQLISITLTIADLAATLRANYGLKTPDALHVAVAVDSNCDVFLTNDSLIVTQGRISCK